MKLGVIAGTIVDTQMGADLLEKYNHTPISLPMSNNCIEQSKIQYYSSEELQELFIQKCKTAIQKGAEKIFLYCNSLSCAIDYNKVSNILNIPIISPLESYKNLPEDCKNVVIIGANGLSAFTIDKIIQEHHENIGTICYGNISIVQMIEDKKHPKEIIKELNLYEFLNYLENIPSTQFKIDSILLGCTHFPYIKEEIEKITKLRIIDPTLEMINKI